MKKMIAILLAVVLLLGTVCVEPQEAYAAAVEDRPVVIVLDPGHGGFDGGATRTWSGKTYREKTLNLSIAKYCKKELEQYAGVKVYLTRADDRYLSLEGRVIFAETKNADAFVCLHNNAGLKTSERGASVFYPNTGYGEEISEQGQGLAESIREQLVMLGLKDQGVHYRNTENRAIYPDRTVADYYRVIKQSKLCGFPGIIVEHAYVSNPSDCKTYLGTEAKLKKLGEADAAGIASYFGLVKGGRPTLLKAENQPDGSVVLMWTEAVGMDGYAIYRRKTGAGTFTRIAVVAGVAGTNYVDTEAAGGASYEYCVRAYGGSGTVARCTAESNVQQVTVLGAPAKAAGKLLAGGKKKIFWSRVSGAAGYFVAMRRNVSESFTVVADIGSGSTLAWEPQSGAEDGCEYQVCAYMVEDGVKIAGPYTDPVTVGTTSGNGMLGAVTEGGTVAEDLRYVAGDGGVMVTAYTGSHTQVVIPETLDGNPVVGIADRAFYDCYQVERVTVPRSVVRIGSEAFAECSSLSSLIVEGQQTVIAADAFAACGNVTLWAHSGSEAERFAAAAGMDCKVIRQYSIRYELVGGVNNSANPEYYNNYDGSVVLEKPTRAGYLFAGWYQNPDDTQAVCDLHKLAVDGTEVTLYALWYRTPGTVRLKKAESRKSGQIRLTWKAGSGADGYVIYRRFSGGVWKKVATVKDGTRTAYTDKEAVSGLSYSYTVRPYKKIGGKNYYGSYNQTGVTAVCR